MYLMGIHFQSILILYSLKLNTTLRVCVTLWHAQISSFEHWNSAVGGRGRGGVLYYTANQWRAHTTLDCQNSMETCSLFFWNMCPETLLFGSNTVMDFSTYIKTEIKGKFEKKKENMSIPPWICCVLSVFVLCHNHRYFF